MSDRPRPPPEFLDERDERAWVTLFATLIAGTYTQRLSQEQHAALMAEEADALLQHVRARRPKSFFGPYRK